MPGDDDKHLDFSPGFFICLFSTLCGPVVLFNWCPWIRAYELSRAVRRKQQKTKQAVTMQRSNALLEKKIHILKGEVPAAPVAQPAKLS